MSAAEPDNRGFETRAIHHAQEPEPVTGAITVPVFQTSTFAQQDVGKHAGYEYARTGNPTRTALESALASLEGLAFGRSFASGMSATDTVLRATLGPGDHLLLGNDAYGGTYRLISKVLAPTGIEWSPVDLTDLDAVAAAWTDKTKMVWLETPTNPRLTVVDIAGVADIAHRHDGLVVVDNTFATPYLQQPAAHGADIVTHSTTKYLGGHSDVVGGFIGCDDPALDEAFAFLQNAVGAVPGPWDCYLTLRGIKTLGVRMDRHSSNAEAVVAVLENHPAVSSVLYPGLSSHPSHAAAKKQMPNGFGGMVSFRLAGGEAAAREIVTHTKVFTLAESLGAVESLIEYPAAMTHASAADSPLEVEIDLVRISVGIETEADLVADITEALDALS